MNELKEKLKIESLQEIRNYLKECHKKYINNKEKTIYIDFLYGIDEYDKLIEILELDEERDLLINEMVDRVNYLDIISIFKTNIPDLYFSRIEQYAYADEDAVVYRLAFIKNKNKLLKESKEYAKGHDFIKERKN